VRRPIVAANWKMHKTRADAARFARDIAAHIKPDEPIETVLAPSFTLLPAVAAEIEGSSVALAAQNVHPDPQGAFTGEISVAMLAELGCRYTLVGHSERRALFGETDAFIARKVAALQRGGIAPILCVGETLAERESGHTELVLATQLAGSLAELDRGAAAKLVLAYEPVWAIGTGRTATPEMAQDAHAFLRKELEKLLGSVADQVRIQYGGSVKPDNAAALLAQPDIDGALVGGASLDLESFLAIIRSGTATTGKGGS
jgi:triosephosphate isomerase (TIM)